MTTATAPRGTVGPPATRARCIRAGCGNGPGCDGRHRYWCEAQTCPGLPYRPTELPHPCSRDEQATLAQRQRKALLACEGLPDALLGRGSMLLIYRAAERVMDAQSEQDEDRARWLLATFLAGDPCEMADLGEALKVASRRQITVRCGGARVFPDGSTEPLEESAR